MLIRSILCTLENTINKKHDSRLKNQSVNENASLELEIYMLNTYMLF